MNRHYLISAGVDMIKFVADLMLENKPLSRSLAVFPGKRPGYFLHKYLADHLKTAYVPPRVLAGDGFIEELAREIGLPGRTVEAIDCLAAIYRMNDKSRVIARDLPELTLDEFLFWGYKLFDDFEELCIEEIAPETLKTIEPLIEDRLPSGIRRKLNALSDLYKAFHRDLDKRGLVTRSLQYRRVADQLHLVKLDNLDQVYICGFFAMTATEKRIFRKLAEDERFQFVFQQGPGIEQIIADLGVKPVKTGDQPKNPVIRFHKAMDGHAEIFKLNQVIQAERDLGSRDVIMAPLAEALFPLVQNTLGFVESYNISMPYPIYRTPLITMINALARLRENVQGEDCRVVDYMRLVLHPYVKNIYLDQSSPAGRIIFHAVEEEFMNNQRRFLNLPALEQDRELLNDCVKRLRGFKENKIDQGKIREHLKRVHDVLIRPFIEIRDIADIAEKIIRAVSFISRESPVNQHAYTVTFVKAMIDGLYALQVSDLGPEKLSAPDRYFRLIRNCLQEVSCPFSGTPVKGLQVLGFQEIRNIKFDRVFLLDVNEGVVPGTTKEDTTLPFAVRKALNLPTHEDEERVSRYYFETLIAGCRQADVFYVEGEDRERSRFVERLIWDFQKKSGKIEDPSADVFFAVQFRHKDPMNIRKSKLFRQYVRKGLRFSPSSINAYLRCPLAYYYGDILGLGVKTGVAEDPDAMGVGSLVHRILMEFFIPKIGEDLKITRADYLAMDKIIEKVFQDEYPDADRGSIYLIKSQTRRQLKNLLGFHQKEARFKNTKIIECENWRKSDQKPNGHNKSTAAPFELKDKMTVMMSGRIDRVDDRGGNIYIVDYKTGTWINVPDHKKFDLNRREEWTETLISIQLPAYIFLYSANNPNAKASNMNAGLMLLGGKEIKEAMLFDEDLSGDQRVDLYEKYCQAIRIMIEEILDPDRDFIPCKDSEVCEWCDYQTICGRQWVV